MKTEMSTEFLKKMKHAFNTGALAGKYDSKELDFHIMKNIYNELVKGDAEKTKMYRTFCYDNVLEIESTILSFYDNYTKEERHNLCELADAYEHMWVFIDDDLRKMQMKPQN